MPPSKPATVRFRSIAQAIQRTASQLAAVEAGPSQAGLPSGSATGGQSFEAAVAGTWRDFSMALIEAGCVTTAVKSGGATMSCLSLPSTERRLYLLGPPSDFGITETHPEPEVPEAWARTQFLVSDLVRNHLGTDFLRYAPRDERDSRDYSGKRYPRMFEGKTTKFDFTAVCEESGVLREKLLFEYKSAKSTRGSTVDGNAHERLSFQTLQYLEVAAMLPNTTFNVIGSSSFSRYKNKYHVSFNQHAVRLGDAFRYFVMRFMACESEYQRFFGMLASWLVSGGPLLREYRDINPA